MLTGLVMLAILLLVVIAAVLKLNDKLADLKNKLLGMNTRLLDEEADRRAQLKEHMQAALDAYSSIWKALTEIKERLNKDSADIVDLLLHTGLIQKREEAQKKQEALSTAVTEAFTLGKWDEGVKKEFRVEYFTYDKSKNSWKKDKPRVFRRAKKHKKGKK